MSLKIKIKLGVILSFSLYKIHEKNYINESAILVIENSISILLEEFYKDNIDVIISDKNKFKNTKQVNVKSLKMRRLIYKRRLVIHIIFLKIIL